MKTVLLTVFPHLFTINRKQDELCRSRYYEVVQSPTPPHLHALALDSWAEILMFRTLKCDCFWRQTSKEIIKFNEVIGTVPYSSLIGVFIKIGGKAQGHMHTYDV